MHQKLHQIPCVIRHDNLYYLIIINMTCHLYCHLLQILVYN